MHLVDAFNAGNYSVIILEFQNGLYLSKVYYEGRGLVFCAPYHTQDVAKSAAIYYIDA